MNRAMLAAASGMAAQQAALEAVSDNLANAGVVGFKGSALTFADALGGGTALAGRHLLLTPGKLVSGGGPFDLAIDGPGFFSVRDRFGGRAYTRAGDFSRSADGTLRNGQGAQLLGVCVPADARSIAADGDGTVWCQTPHGKIRAGKIALADFPSPEHLRGLGDALYAATPQSGPPRTLRLGDDTRLVTGSLERSNVSVVEAMMQILSAQRIYEANSKGVQAADEMQRIANNIQRS